MRRVRLLSIAVLTVAGSAWGQVGFNVDLNCEFCPPPLGGGSPSDSFGGEDDIQRGYWNALPGGGHNAIALRDLKGNLTSVLATGYGSGSSGGYRFEGNTGDVALLQNDGGDVTDSSTWILQGLPNGFYRVVTYAALPDERPNPTPVIVFGVEKIVTGPMIANGFETGVTHVVHTGRVTDGTLAITVLRGAYHPGWINGFQLMQVVPEPSVLVGLATSLLALALRRRHAGRP